MRLLLTGANGFTGRYIADAAITAGYMVCPLKSDLTDAQSLLEEIRHCKPTHVVHLAAISDISDSHQEAYYRVNLFGSLNLLNALESLKIPPRKIIFASSANVYGTNGGQFIDELTPPRPLNQYAMSKLSMEYMSSLYAHKLPILYTRPFNYTGVGHDNRFVIPKIVSHFIKGETQIELGNIKVEREYNDVRDVANVYVQLLEKGSPGETYNIASGKSYTLKRVLDLLSDLTNQPMHLFINPAFVRKNEISVLSGNSNKLETCIGRIDWVDLQATLRWMLSSPRN